MALQFAHGALTWNAADVATTVYTVSGLPFQPKVLKFSILGLASAVDASSEVDSGRVSVGIATSTSDRRCMGFIDVDAAAAADTDAHYRDDAVLATTDGAGAITGLLDLNTITSDGFTLVVDDQGAVDLRVFWEAWGGSDILNATTGELIEPAVTGNQDYVVTGSFQPSVLFLVGTQLTAAPPTQAVQSAALSYGAATGATAQFVVMTHSDEGAATMDTDGYMRGDEILAMPAGAGGNPTARATFVQFNADGFQLNWIARASTRRFMYLAVQGGQWSVSTATIDVTAVNNTQTIAGLAFTPIGGVMAGRGRLQQTAGTSDAAGVLVLGSWVSATDRRSQGYRTDNGTGNAEVNLTISYDEILAVPSSAGGTIHELDLDAITSDGFRVIVDTADAGGSTATLFGYVTFGDLRTAEISPMMILPTFTLAPDQIVSSGSDH